MADIAAGQRKWKCPDCGTEVLLSITQLDPMACDACLAKLKQGRSKPVKTAVPGMPALPSGLLSLLVVGGAMLVFGLAIGFVLGRISAPAPVIRPTRPDDETKAPGRSSEPATEAETEAPDESTRPGDGYKWVRGHTRKDGVKVKGHWAKDPNFVEPDKKRKR